jgi:hypothetical protein
MNEEKKVDSSAAPNAVAASRHGGAWWRLPLLLAVVLLAMIAARATRVSDRTTSTRDSAPPPAATDGRTVSLTLRYGGDQERSFDKVAWHDGMTIDDLMTAVSRLPEAPMYRISGDGQMAFVVGIDDAFNEGGRGRFWTYQVNDVPGDRSFAVFELQPGDRVLWTFGSQQ